MTPPIFQLLIIAFGLFLVIKSVYSGALIGILPLGWFVADGLPSSLAVPIWLLSSLIFGLLLLIRLGKNDRNTKKLPQ